MSASIKTLALGDDRHPRFVFRNDTTGELLFAGDLVGMILNAYAAGGQTVDFDTTFTYDIELSFNNELGVSVTINGWEFTPKDIEV
jgi:hypothetical protein